MNESESGPVPTVHILQQADELERRASISRQTSTLRTTRISLEDALSSKKLDWHLCSINQPINQPQNNQKQLPKLIFTISAIDHVILKNAKRQLIIDCLIDRSIEPSSARMIDEPHIRLIHRQVVTHTIRLVDLVACDRSLSFEHPYLIQLVYRTCIPSKKHSTRNKQHQRSHSSLTTTNELLTNPSPRADAVSTHQSASHYIKHVLNLTLCSLRDVDDVSTILSAVIRLRQVGISAQLSINQTIQSTQSVSLPHNLLSGSVSGMLCLHQDIVELLDQSIYQSNKRVLQLFPNRLLVYRLINQSIYQSISQQAPVYVFPLTLDNNESHVVVTNGVPINQETSINRLAKPSKVITLKMSHLTVASLDPRFATLSFKCSSIDQATKWLDAFEIEKSASFKTPVSSLITDRFINQLMYQTSQDAQSPSQYHAVDQRPASSRAVSGQSIGQALSPSNQSVGHASSPSSVPPPSNRLTNQSLSSGAVKPINQSSISNTYNQSTFPEQIIKQKGLMARSVSAPSVHTRPTFAYRLIDIRSEEISLPPVDSLITESTPANDAWPISHPVINEPKVDALLSLSLADSLRQHSHSRDHSNNQSINHSNASTAEGPLFRLPSAPASNMLISHAITQPDPSLFSLSTLLRSQHAFFNYLHHLSIKPAINQSKTHARLLTLADWRKKTSSSLFKKRSQTLQRVDSLLEEYLLINQSIYQCFSESRLFVLDVADIASACQIGFAFIGFESQLFDVGRLSVVSIAQLLSLDPSNPCNFTVDDWSAALASLSPAKELMQCSPDIDQMFSTPDGVAQAKQLSYAAQRLVLHNCCLSAYIKVRMGNQSLNQSNNHVVKSNEIIRWCQVLEVLEHLGSTGNQALLAEFVPVGYMVNPRPQCLHALISEVSKRSSSINQPLYVPAYASPGSTSQLSSPSSMRVTPLPLKATKAERQHSADKAKQLSNSKPVSQSTTTSPKGKFRGLFGGHRRLASAADISNEPDETSTSISDVQSPSHAVIQEAVQSSNDCITSFYSEVTGGDLRLLLNPLHLLVVLLETLKMKQSKLNELATVCLDWMNAHVGERGERADAFIALSSGVAADLDIINDAMNSLPTENELLDEYSAQQIDEKVRINRGEQIKRRHVDLDAETQLEVERVRALQDLANFPLPVMQSRATSAEMEADVVKRESVESAMSLLDALRLDEGKA